MDGQHAANHAKEFGIMSATHGTKKPDSAGRKVCAYWPCKNLVPLGGRLDRQYCGDDCRKKAGRKKPMVRGNR